MNYQENILVRLKFVKINDQNIELLSKTLYNHVKREAVRHIGDS